jgi:hypothetical protein
MLECKEFTASFADVATAAGEWAATAAAKAWDVTSLASATAATLTASVARRMEQVDWRVGKQHLRNHQRRIFLSGLSMAVSLSAIYYLSSLRRQRLVSSATAAPEGGDDGAPPPSTLSSVTETPTKSSVLGREIEFHSEEAAPENTGTSALRTPVKTTLEDDAVASTAAAASATATATPTDSPDTSFETATSMDGSEFGDGTVATTDPDSAKGRVKELNRLAKSFSRKRKVRDKIHNSLIRDSSTFSAHFQCHIFSDLRQFTEAADSHTEALYILETVEASDKISALIVTLLNNRSLVYEEAGRIDLAIEDCQRLLALGKGVLSPMQQPRVQKRLMRLQQLSAAGSATPSPKKRSPLRLSFLKKVGFSPNRAGRTPKATTPS